MSQYYQQNILRHSLLKIYSFYKTSHVTINIVGKVTIKFNLILDFFYLLIVKKQTVLGLKQ